MFFYVTNTNGKNAFFYIKHTFSLGVIYYLITFANAYV